MFETLTAKLIGGGVLFLAIGGAFWYMYHKGEESVQAKWDAYVIEANVQADAIRDATKIVVNFHNEQLIERTNILLSQGATIQKEVKVYVTQKADSQCTLTNGYVRVLNAAAGGPGLDAGPAAGSNDTAAGIAVSDSAAVISENYRRCRTTAAELDTLQRAWLDAKAKVTQP